MKQDDSSTSLRARRYIYKAHPAHHYYLIASDAALMLPDAQTLNLLIIIIVKILQDPALGWLIAQ